MALNIDVPPGGRMLHKKVVEDPASGANRCVVTTLAELEAALKDGWALSAGELADPRTSPGGTQRGPETKASIKASGAPEPADAEKAGIKVGGADASVLDGTVADITAEVEGLGDVQELLELRAKEVKGRNRAGVLKVITDRIAAIKDDAKRDR